MVEPAPWISMNLVLGVTAYASSFFSHHGVLSRRGTSSEGYYSKKKAPDCTRRRPKRHPVYGFDRPALPRTCYWLVQSQQVSSCYQQRCQINGRTRQVYDKQISPPLRLWFPTTPDANPWRGFPVANCQADPSQDSSIYSTDIMEKRTGWKLVD